MSTAAAMEETDPSPVGNLGVSEGPPQAPPSSASESLTEENDETKPKEESSSSEKLSVLPKEEEKPPVDVLEVPGVPLTGGKRILEEEEKTGSGSSVCSKRIRSSVEAEEKKSESIVEEAEKDGSPPSVVLEDDDDISILESQERPPVPTPLIPESEMQEVRRGLVKMKRSQLEELVLQKMVDFLFYESEIGALRSKCDYFEEVEERSKKKMLALQKQCEDLNTVMQRYMKDVSNSNAKERVTPVRVTRSVGLQVRLPPKTAAGTNNTAASLGEKNAGTTLQSAGFMKKITNNSSLTVLHVTDGKGEKKGPVGGGCGNNMASGSNTAMNPTATNNNNTSTTTMSTTSTNNDNKSLPNKGQVIDVVDLIDDDDAETSNVVSKPLCSIAPSSQRRSLPNGVPPNVVIGKASLVPLGTNSRGGPISGAGNPSSFPISVAPRSNNNLMSSSNQHSSSNNNSNSINNPNRVIRLNSSNPMSTGGNNSSLSVSASGHPAPLPPSNLGPVNPNWKWPPPKPSLKISRLRSGIVLSWNLDIKPEHSAVLSYQLFAYQETNALPSSSLWRKVGDVKALPLPMACTLTQFMKGNKYHFAIRAMDSHNRLGPFSDASSILLT